MKNEQSLSGGNQQKKKSDVGLFIEHLVMSQGRNGGNKSLAGNPGRSLVRFSLAGAHSLMCAPG